MESALSEQIEILPTLNKAKLLGLWTEHFSTDPPPTLRKELMVPILAYRMQEKAFGGLSHKARKQLEEIAKSQVGKRRKPNEQACASYLRMWRNEMHEVKASDDGYEYRGERFPSLSRIAHKITGTHWSGPAFFGIKPRSVQ